MKRFWSLLLIPIMMGCTTNPKTGVEMSFQDDVQFLKQYTGVHILSGNNGNAQVLVCPDLQGRVMTSTAAGPDVPGFGWINYDLFRANENNPHFNAYGGEERIWLGPEGGQFSVFFKKGDPFDLDHWYTPKGLNEEKWDIAESSGSMVRFVKPMSITNYSGTPFDLELDRTIKLLDNSTVSTILDTKLAQDLNIVAYQTDNVLKNTGSNAWTKDGGLLSIWILGMFTPSPTTTIAIPYKTGPETELGPIVNDVYFGKVPADRLKIDDGILYFSGDGNYRSKIGLSPQRCTPWAGSYDSASKVLTLVTYSFDPSNTDYVNSLWEIQEKPFSGDVVNSYNDGPADPDGSLLGPFYELETSSPAAALAPGSSLLHTSTTMHIQGDEAKLNSIAKAVLGVGIEDIKTAFK